MKRAWLAAIITAAAVAQARECRPDVQLLTVYMTTGAASVPNDVLARAKHMAARVLDGAGVTVEWVKGKAPRNSGETYCGDRLTIVFDPSASTGFRSQAMAYVTLNAGWATEIHVFYDRMSQFPDRSRMPEFLGHILAHEITHVLQGVARHSGEGVMKARWTDRDCAELVRKPLSYSAEDVELIRAHFGERTPETARARTSGKDARNAL